MSALIRMPRAAWRRQPQGSSRIDFSSSLCAGLAEAYSMQSGLLSLVRQSNPTVTNNPVLVYGDTAVGLSFDTTKKLAYPLTATNPPLTLLTQYVIRSTTSIGRIAGAFEASVSGFTIAPNSTNYRALIATAGANTVVLGTSIVTMELKTDVLVVGNTGNPRSVSFWENGILSATGSGNYTASSGGFTLGADNGVGINAGAAANANIYLTALWNRALSSAEIIALSQNPWQLFQPRPARFFLIPDAAGGGSWTLVLSNASHLQDVAAPTLTQANTLSLQTASHLHSVTAPTLSVSVTLSAANAEQAQTTGTISLTQAHILTLANASQLQTTSGIDLLQGYTLSLSNSSHLQTVSAPALTQANTLILSPAVHLNTTPNVVLTQANTLSVNATSHLHTAESLTLDSGLVLSLSMPSQLTTVTTPSLTQASTLNLDFSIQVQSVESPNLIQANVLSVGNGTQNQIAGTVSLSQGVLLQLQVAAQTQTAEPITLSAGLVLQVLNAVHEHNASLINLSTHITLVVSNALHHLYSGHVGFSTIFPTGSVLVVQAEDRLLLVMAEDRILSVH